MPFPSRENAPSRLSEYPYSTVTELIREKWTTNAEDTFVIEEATHTQFTYGNIEHRSLEIGAAFHESGIAKGDIVATILPNSVDQLVIWFAAMQIGAIFAPLNTEFHQDDLAHALTAVQPDAMVVDSECLSAYLAVDEGGESISAELIRDKSETDAENERPKLADVSAPVSRCPSVDPHPSDPAIITFTGGSTGLPKPVVHSQFAPLTGAYRYVNAFDVRPSDRQFTTLQLYHGGGQQYTLGPMLADSSLVLVEKFSASEFFNQVNRYGATITDIVGPMLGALLRTHDAPVENSLRYALGMLDYERHVEAQRRFDLDLLKLYALTEGGGILLTYTTFDADAENSSREGELVGHSGEWARIAILDETGARVEPGTVGEICLRPTIPHSMMECYYERPEATVEAWNELWIHTGDLGWMTEDDELYYVGRQAHWLRRMGENISSQEVETVLNDHPAVVESAVVGAENQEIGGEDVRVFIKSDHEIQPHELVEWCGERLAEFKVPRYIEFVDEFPRGQTKNQILRHELRDRSVAGAWDRDNA